jgi:hypothetical protein
MKRIAAGVVALTALLAAAAAMLTAPAARSSGPPSTSAEAQRLRSLENTRLHALVDVNMPVIEAIHAEDFQVVPPPGFPLSREEYLAALASGDIDYLEFKPISPIDVRLYGQAAVLTYMSHIDIVVTGIGHVAHDAWHTYVYERRDGRWQAVWEQATAIGGIPEPS